MNLSHFCTRSLLGIFLITSLAAFAPAKPGDGRGGGTKPIDPSLYKNLKPATRAVAEKLAKSAPQIPQPAILRAFTYYDQHPSIIDNKDYITIIDFTLPSTMDRQYMIDMKTSAISTYLVAHGKNSGDNFATKFSNISGSYQSSLGIYLTGSDYQGSHGTSMYLHGKESTNSNAFDRAIVVHPADYVSKEFIRDNGRLGRSWGCPALNPKVSLDIIRKIKGRSVYYIYHATQSK